MNGSLPVERGGPVQTLRNLRGDQFGHLEILGETSLDTWKFWRGPVEILQLFLKTFTYRLTLGTFRGGTGEMRHPVYKENIL